MSDNLKWWLTTVLGAVSAAASYLTAHTTDSTQMIFASIAAALSAILGISHSGKTS